MSHDLDHLRTARSRVVGVKQTLKAVQRGQVSIVFMAHDADVHVLRELQQACSAQGVPIVWVTSMQELGRAAGIQVGSATAAVLR